MKSVRANRNEVVAANERLAAIATHLVVGGTILAVVWFARFSDPDVIGAQTTPGGAAAKGTRGRRGQS